MYVSPSRHVSRNICQEPWIEYARNPSWRLEETIAKEVGGLVEIESSFKRVECLAGSLKSFIDFPIQVRQITTLYFKLCFYYIFIFYIIK